ncbi:MAG TPA: response regulator, partial [Pirellulales bacterium]|nr:response regulator [Pirellulales bacterium]
IVDHDPETRHTLSTLIRGIDLEVEIFADAREFLRVCDADSRGCAVLDVRLPLMSGLDLQQALLARGVRLPIIFLSADEPIPTVSRAFRAGAIDVIQKPCDVNMLLERIGEAIQRDLTQHERQSRQLAVSRRLAQLSKREVQVMELIAAGASTKSAARQLGISSKTVDNHRLRILQKLGVSNPVELARLVLSAMPAADGAAMAWGDEPPAATVPAGEWPREPEAALCGAR